VAVILKLDDGAYGDKVNRDIGDDDYPLREFEIEVACVALQAYFNSLHFSLK
jgi:hypothetical protein